MLVLVFAPFHLKDARIFKILLPFFILFTSVSDAVIDIGEGKCIYNFTSSQYS